MAESKDDVQVFYLLLILAALFLFSSIIYRANNPTPLDQCIDACKEECKNADSKGTDK
jgi:hypothetical protein